MTLREKICESEATTLREYLCLEKGVGEDVIVDRIVPYTNLELEIEKKVLDIDIWVEEVDV